MSVLSFQETSCGPAPSVGSSLFFFLHAPLVNIMGTWLWLQRSYAMWEVSFGSVCEPASQWVSTPSTNQLSVRWFPSSLALTLCVYVCARARSRCVRRTSALQPPHPHKGTHKIKSRSWSLSFQLLPSFQRAHSRKKPRCAPAGRSERWWTGGGWMLREAAWCTGRGARGSWRWSLPCRTCWWPRAC